MRAIVFVFSCLGHLRCTLQVLASPEKVSRSAEQSKDGRILTGHHPASAFVPTYQGRILNQKSKKSRHVQQMRRIEDQRKVFAHLLIGTHTSQQERSWSRRGIVNMEWTLATPLAQLQKYLGFLQSLDGMVKFKFQEAAVYCDDMISSISNDTLSDKRNIDGQLLKMALLTRAQIDHEFGNVEKSIAGCREVLIHEPNYTRAKCFLAAIFQDSCEDSIQDALDICTSAAEDRIKPRFFEYFTLDEEGSPYFELPLMGNGNVLQRVAGLGGVSAAASIGDHERAQHYLDLMYEWQKTYTREPEDFKFELCWFDMMNALCAGNTERATQKKEELARIAPGTLIAPNYLASWEHLQVSLAPTPYFFQGTRRLLQFAMDAASVQDGLVLEFGVYYGKSMGWIASRFPDAQVHGFDTFSGLPEDWPGLMVGKVPGPAKGSYSTQGTRPLNLPENVELHAGLFSETLPGFLDAHAGPIRFMNIDCDIYSSTKDIFDQVSSRIVPGTVIVFDEMFFVNGWQNNEFKAFQEAVAENNWTYEYLAASFISNQGIVRIT